MTIEHSSESSHTKIYDLASPFITTQNTNPLIRPKFTISNITNFIKINLSIENANITLGMNSELFKIHVCVHQVIDHIIPTDTTSSPNLKDDDRTL